MCGLTTTKSDIMDYVEILFLGWVRHDNHDKVWGAIKVGERYFALWGRRGKRMKFKEHRSEFKLRDLIYNKRREGYEPFNVKSMDEYIPNFKESVEEQLVFAELSGSVM